MCGVALVNGLVMGCCVVASLYHCLSDAQSWTWIHFFFSSNFLSIWCSSPSHHSLQSRLSDRHRCNILNFRDYRLFVLLDPFNDWLSELLKSPVFQPCVELSVVCTQHKHDVEPPFREEVAAVIVDNHAAFNHPVFQLIHHLEGATHSASTNKVQEEVTLSFRTDIYIQWPLL